MVKIIQVLLIILYLNPHPAEAEDWDVDFSRRMKEVRKTDYVTPEGKQEQESLFDLVFDKGAPVQEVVLLNTEHGFIPQTVRVRQGAYYRIHIVNVNEKQKNVSFVMDSFSEHHATYYGKIKSFHIQPKKEGIYTFQCPETSAQGRLVVHQGSKGDPLLEMREPASER